MIKFDSQDYDDDDHDDDNDENDENDENDDHHDEAVMLKKLRLDELKNKYGLENQLENLKKKNQWLQDSLRVVEDLFALKLIDLRVRKTFLPFILPK